MLPSRAVHRSPSHGRSLTKYDDDRLADQEAARPSSPKKAEPPSYRRQKPLALMCLILLITFLLGVMLFVSQKGSYSKNGKVTAAAGAAPGLGPSIAPQKAWNLPFKTKLGYENRISVGDEYIEFTAPGLFVRLRDALDLNFPLQEEELRLQESPTTTLLEPQNYNNQDGGGSGSDDGRVENSQVNSLRDSFNSLWSSNPLLNSTISTTAYEEPGKSSKGRHLGQIYTSSTETQQPPPQPQKQKQHSTLHAAFSIGAETQEEWPQPDGIRLLVAVTSACCTQVSLQRRAAIRRTWAALINERYHNFESGGITITFFLAQPENETELAEWLPELEEEIVSHNDTVILRGKDAYLNLPNKTFRMLRYALASPREFTHVLKTDDDTWVRMHKVLEYLQQPAESGSGGAAAEATAAVLAAAIQRKTELEQMSRSRGAPIVSEGMTLYDATSIVERIDQDEKYAKESVDDIDGSRVTLAELARRSNWYANRARNAMFQEASIKHQHQQKTQKNSFGDVQFGGEAEQDQEERKKENGDGAEEAVGRQLLRQFPAPATRARMSGVYLGCIENERGFQPIRDKNNKWYVSEKDLPNDAYPHGVKYLAGWGYLLSRDLIMHIVQKVNAYESQPESAPLWYNSIKFEDVLVGLLLHDVVPLPESHSGFRPAWRSCVPDTAVRHLDIDSPRLLKGLVEQDSSGLADIKPVQCSTGLFLPGDYSGWFAWKSSLV